MIRIIVFLAAIALAAFGFAWLIDRPGSLVLNWQGWEIETSIPVALLVVVLLALGLLVLWWFFRTIFHIPDAFSHFMRGRRRRRGLDAVAHGLVAIGIGDGRAARRSATEARRLIGDEPLTLLLRAQAAQLSGDRGEAEAAFRAMLEQRETRPLGYRGLFVEARRRGDDREALEIAARAVRADPQVPWAGPALLDLQSATRNWDGAIAAVEGNLAARVINRPTRHRQRAVLLTAKALDRADEHPEEAREIALEAVGLAPELIPAAALAGRLVAEGGDVRKAGRIIEKAWKIQPHPDLADVFLYVRPGDAALDRLKRARRLADRAGRDPEGKLALARAAIDAREFALARQSLTPLVEAGPTRRVCLLMAELDDAEHGDRGRARAWLTRALVAARDPAWIADGMVSDRWQPISPISGRLDAFVWAVPQDTLAAPDSPLIDAEVLATEAAPVVRQIEALKTEPITEPSSPGPSAQEPEMAPQPPPVIAKPRPALPRRSRGAPVEVVLPLARAPDDPGPDEEPGLDRVTVPSRAPDM